jgi:cytochrome oxidase Cu insertion factor (SCO1/SenC/PrrC family)
LCAVWALALAGCGSKGVATQTPQNTFGAAPVAALPLPDFKATSHDGTPRGPEDLRGHPTVLWFFPMVGTPG